MTLQEAIDKYKMKFPSNPYDDEQLADHINTLDNMAQMELLDTFPYVYTTDEEGNVVQSAGTLAAYSYPADAEKRLLLSETPYEDLYGLYLAAMAFFDQQDWMKYSNCKGMFNARYLDALNYYSRTNPPIKETKITNIW